MAVLAPLLQRQISILMFQMLAILPYLIIAALVGYVSLNTWCEHTVKLGQGLARARGHQQLVALVRVRLRLRFCGPYGEWHCSRIGCGSLAVLSGGCWHTSVLMALRSIDAGLQLQRWFC